MIGHEEGDCSKQSEQQCERHASQMISWIMRQSTTDYYVVVCIARSHVCLVIVCRCKIDSCLDNFVTQQTLCDKVA